MKKLINRITASLGYLLGALGLEEEAPRNTYDPKPWRDVRRAAETDQLEERLAEAKEQAESWRRMAMHLMERSA